MQSKFGLNFITQWTVFALLFIYLSHLFFYLEQLKANLGPSVKEAPKDGGPGHIAAHTFTFRELAAATKNFRADCILGEGGFGQVYKGRLESTNQVLSKALTINDMKN